MTTPLDLEDIFLAALVIGTPQGRAAYLDEECRDQPNLRREVERLLAAHPDMGSFLEVPPAAVTVDRAIATDEPVSERPGTVIGPYRLLEQIGEGGFGIVFMAEQFEPIRRKVALKVIKPGMDTRQVIARFEAERQALALMDHPNIAKVFDAGTTAQVRNAERRVQSEDESAPAGTLHSALCTLHSTGRPYFVMELVRGVPITEYCDHHQLPTPQRLELFIDVCQAIQHAHQKGIIHRDVKPSNVLVTHQDGKPVPKVIDFGVAKAMIGQLTDKSLFTGYAQLIGTPLYMSPEQAEMCNADIDTRSDVYSLGVLLYELLTGTTPFESQRLKAASYDELRRILREEEPARPSTRITTLGQAATTVSTNRQSDPRRLSRLYRGELDWIVLKALEKDRNRRYESANGLALDVQRYLADEPVQACPPAATYRLRKFMRRNKTEMTIAGVIALAVLLAAGSLGWMVRDRASRQAVLDQNVSQALEDIESFYGGDQLDKAMGAVERAEALLDSGRRNLELRQRVRLWREDLELVTLLEELRLYKSHVADEGTIGDPVAVDAAYLKTWRHYGLALEGADAAEFARKFRGRRIAAKVALSLDDWAAIGRQSRGEKEASWRELLKVAEQLDPDRWRNQLRDALRQPDSRRALEEFVRSAPIEELPPATLELLGKTLWTVHAFKQAVVALRKGVERHPNDFWINYLLAINYGQLKPPQWDESVRYYTVAAALRPENHIVQYFCAGAHENNGSVDEAIVVYQRAARLQPDFAAAHNRLGHAFLWRKRRVHDAVAAFQQAVHHDPKDALSYCSLGQALRMDGQLDEAIAACREAIRLKSLHPHDESKAHYEIGKALWYKGLPEEAEAAFKEALRLQPSLKANLANDRTWLSIMYPGRSTVTVPQAIELAKQAAALEPNDARWWNTLGAAHYRAGNWKEAVAALERSIAMAGGDVFDWLFLAMSHWQQGDKVQARKWYDRAMLWLNENQSDDNEIRRIRDEAEWLMGITNQEE